MKSMLFAMAVTCLAHVATAGDERNGAHSLTCWYDESGTYTGYAPAPAGATAGTKTQTAASGAHTWSYTVAGEDPAACPAKLPVSTLTGK
jgi:hypothetical protein